MERCGGARGDVGSCRRLGDARFGCEAGLESGKAGLLETKARGGCARVEQPPGVVVANARSGGFFHVGDRERNVAVSRRIHPQQRVPDYPVVFPKQAGDDHAAVRLPQQRADQACANCIPDPATEERAIGVEPGDAIRCPGAVAAEVSGGNDGAVRVLKNGPHSASEVRCGAE